MQQLHIDQGNPSSYTAWTTLNCVWKATAIGAKPYFYREHRLHRPYCGKHNQHVNHANARGVWGHAIQLEIDTLTLNLGAFKSQTR